VKKPEAPPRSVKIASGLLAAMYPLLIFVGLRWLEPRWMAAAIGATVAIRAALRWRRPSPAELRRLVAPVLLVAGVLGTAFVANDARTLLFVPVLVNAALLLAFVRTLSRGTPMVETVFAVEFVVRSWRFQLYAGSVVEPLFRRIFPPPPG